MKYREHLVYSTDNTHNLTWVKTQEAENSVLTDVDSIKSGSHAAVIPACCPAPAARPEPTPLRASSAPRPARLW